MHNRMSATVAIALVACVPVFADEAAHEVIAATPGASYVRSAPAGWRAATRVEDVGEQIPRPKSSLTIRAYEGFAGLRPYYGEQPATGVDVRAEMETCPDGNTRISALNIGGWLFAVDGDCSVDRRPAPVSAMPADDGGEEAEDQAGKPVLRCDPATWRCRNIDR